MRNIRIVLCAALTGSIALSGGAAVQAACETVYVDVYDVDVEPDRKSYRLGDTAVIRATVTRTDSGAPVADATFFAYLTPTRKGFVFAAGRTDDSGHAIARLKLKRNAVEVGPADLVGRAQKQAADASCAQVTEFGEERVQNAFVVKR